MTTRRINKTPAVEAKPESPPSPMLNIDGDTYEIDKLPDDIKGLLNRYAKWSKEGEEAKSEAEKCDAACRALSVEISNRLKAIKAIAAAQTSANDA